jgi:hypothetical protein
MNSSPPPPSFTLPPLNFKGQLPVTPSPTPTPTEHGPFDFDVQSARSKGKRKVTEVHDVEQNIGRVSMYVKLFEGKFHRDLYALLMNRDDPDSIGIGDIPLFASRSLGA